MSDPILRSGKRVLVTGGTESIGSAVVRHLVSACDESPMAISVPHSARGDLRQGEAAQRICVAGDGDLHLAAVTGGSKVHKEQPFNQYRDSTLVERNVKVRFDSTTPGGDPRRLASTTRAEEQRQFQPVGGVRDGLRRAVQWYQQPRART